MRTSRRDALRRIAGGLAAALGASACARRASRDDSGRVTASLWFSYGGKNREVLLDLVRVFHERQSRHRIEPVYQGDYFEGLAKLRTAMYAGAAPAVTHVVAEVVPYLAEANVLEHLDRFPGAKTLDLVPALAQEGSYVGGAERPLVALPFNRSTPIAYFNRELFESNHLEPPSTWDELREVARALTARDGASVSRWGFEVPIDWWFWAALVAEAGGELVAADGTPTLGGEAGVRALAFLQTLVGEDRVMRPPPGRDYNAWQATNTDFLAGRAAMIWTSTAFLRYLEDNAKFPVGAAPLPRDVKRGVPTGGTFFVMPRGAPAESQEAAWAFLRFMTSPEQANAWATRTGYLPVSAAGQRSLEASGHYDTHPNDAVAVAQLASASPWPWAPELFRIQREIVQPRLEQAVLENESPARVLDAAVREAREP
jgi:sn-glycerol 3-phosphate transport system substrate-binding protein